MRATQQLGAEQRLYASVRLSNPNVRPNTITTTHFISFLTQTDATLDSVDETLRLKTVALRKRYAPLKRDRRIQKNKRKKRHGEEIQNKNHI